MKRAGLLLVLMLTAPALLAQEDWRERRYSGDRREGAFDLTVFGGVRWGGIVYNSQPSIFGDEIDLGSSASYGASFGIPLNRYGTMVELMVNRQKTEATSGGGLFTPGGAVGDLDVTYYQAGLLFPFARSRSATPFVVVSGGVVNLDPGFADTSSRTKFAASAGVGVKVPLASSLALRAEARGFYGATGPQTCRGCYSSYDDNLDLYQGEASVGLSFRF